MIGCGTPAAPQPPSLRLPELVKDLTAERSGNTVTLHWTTPRKTTDHLLLSTQTRGSIPVRVCVRTQSSRECETVGSTTVAPDAQADYKVELTSTQQAGQPRLLSFFVELKNTSGKSAGFSNAAIVAGGAVPPRVTGLTATVRADGVALHWNADGEATAVRLHRTLLNPESAKPPGAKQPSKGERKSAFSFQGSSSEPLERDLRVDADPASGALDTTAKFGAVYQYTVQRIVDAKVEGKTLELDGAVSEPIRVEVVDVFPPDVPQGLAAVSVEDEKSIDLSWQPDTEEDLAGYIVYRNDGDSGEWRRISGLEPVTSPAYRDAKVEAGRSYRYSVSAIDTSGHESKRSQEAQESVPKP